MLRKVRSLMICWQNYCRSIHDKASLLSGPKKDPGNTWSLPYIRYCKYCRCRCKIRCTALPVMYLLAMRQGAWKRRIPDRGYISPVQAQPAGL